jgi:two-component system, cell cycle sensor histidine kinase and response regulator CckA
MNDCPGQRTADAILLVEDEDVVRELTKRMLERSGYTVLTAANGKEALNLYDEKRDEISLVILDLIMPEMGGEECLAELHRIDPHLKILVTSGYPVYGATKDAVESAATDFVGKPYSMKEILRSVRDVLDREWPRAL